jgi:chromosomal replication initiation ATPase DnaA
VQQDKLWQAVLGDIEISLSRGNYLTWFKNTQLLKQDNDKLVIGVPNVFIKQQLERKYNDLVTETERRYGPCY